MATELTGGFDLAVHVSSDVCGRLLECAFHLDHLPRLLQRRFAFGQAEVDAWLSLGVPKATFDPVGSAVRLGVPFHLVLSTADEEPGGELVMTVPVSVEPGVSSAGEPVSTPVLTLGGLGEVESRFSRDTALTRAVATLVRLAGADALSRQVVRLPIAPSIGGHPHVSSRGYPGGGGFLAIFINRDGRPAPAPLEHPPWLHGSDSALLMPGDWFLSAIADGLRKAGLGDLPAPLPADGSVTVERLDFELRDGQLWVFGTVTKEIDFLPDATADFSAYLLMDIAGGRITVTAHQVEVDLPFWLDAMGFLDPLISGQIIESAVGRAVAALSGRVLDANMPDLQFFVGEVQISTEPTALRPSVTVSPTGPVLIRPGGLVIKADVDVACDRTPAPGPPRPPLLHVHRRTREFHRPGCEYGDRIAPANLIVCTEATAFAEGYSGCGECSPEYSATVPLLFRAPSPPGAHRTMTVTFEMTPLGTFGPIGTDEPRHHEQTTTRWVGEDGELRLVHAFPGLRLGRWHAAVSAEDWRAETEARVFRNQSRRLLFTFGDPDVADLWEDMI